MGFVVCVGYGSVGVGMIPAPVDVPLVKVNTVQSVNGYSLKDVGTVCDVIKEDCRSGQRSYDTSSRGKVQA